MTTGQAAAIQMTIELAVILKTGTTTIAPIPDSVTRQSRCQHLFGPRAAAGTQHASNCALARV